jgi:hypothetical protein
MPMRQVCKPPLCARAEPSLQVWSKTYKSGLSPSYERVSTHLVRNE